MSRACLTLLGLWMGATYAMSSLRKYVYEGPGYLFGGCVCSQKQLPKKKTTRHV